MELHFDSRRWLFAALAVAAVLLGCRYLLPVLLPFLFGLGLALLLSPLISRLQARTGIPRGAVAAAMVTAFLAALILLLWFLGRQLLRELNLLSQELPDILERASLFASALQNEAISLSASLPDGVGEAVRSWAENLFLGTGSVLSTLYDRVVAWASRFLAALPDSFLFLFTAVLSGYFAAAELPTILAFLRRTCPRSVRDRLSRLWRTGRDVLGGWCKAQLQLMGVTFAVVTAGLFFLRVDLALLLGLLIALVDALPVFGTGTILIPWGVVSLLLGEYPKGIGLLVLYGLTALLRNILEPKLLGSQVGLSPLVTLLAIYAGYKWVGIWGMLLFPPAAMVLSQFCRSRPLPQTASAQPLPLWRRILKTPAHR